MTVFLALLTRQIGNVESNEADLGLLGSRLTRHEKIASTEPNNFHDRKCGGWYTRVVSPYPTQPEDKITAAWMATVSKCAVLLTLAQAVENELGQFL